MSAKETSSKVQPGMLYIPDISSFTRFVRNTDIIHIQHIIQELLETIIEANEMGMKKKFRRMIQQTGENVKNLCEEMYANGKSIEGGVYLESLPVEAE